MKRVELRIEPEIYEILTAMADENCRTVVGEVRFLVLQAVASRRKSVPVAAPAPPAAPKEDRRAVIQRRIEERDRRYLAMTPEERAQFDALPSPFGEE